MKASRSIRTVIVQSVLLALLIIGCGPSDPRQRILDERARWEVALLNWSQSASDGTVNIAVRLSGPPNSAIDRLTVLVRLADEQDQVIDSVWHTFDLSDVERGGPADKLIRVSGFSEEIYGAWIEPVYQPTPEQEQHIPELRG
jgi:hypothetical protein